MVNFMRRKLWEIILRAKLSLIISIHAIVLPITFKGWVHPHNNTSIFDVFFALQSCENLLRKNFSPLET